MIDVLIILGIIVLGIIIFPYVILVTILIIGTLCLLYDAVAAIIKTSIQKLLKRVRRRK